MLYLCAVLTRGKNVEYRDVDLSWSITVVKRVEGAYCDCIYPSLDVGAKT